MEKKLVKTYLQPEVKVIFVHAEPLLGENSPFKSDHKNAEDDSEVLD